MKIARVVLSIVACLSAIAISFASHFDRPAQFTYYGVSGGSCTAEALAAGQNDCTKTSGIRCVVVTDGGTQFVPAFIGINSAANPDVCVTPVFRPAPSLL